VNTSSASAAGQRPSFAGYGRSPSERGSRRPIARHGLNARNTSPNSTLTNTMPTQNVMRMNVGAKLSSVVPLPR
jgi:hypothetical protein